MYKKLNGYFTVEASCILPMVLFLYLLIILSSLFLYRRCVISQDSYLLGMRAGRFSRGAENYGEVIYGEKAPNLWQPEAYVLERMNRKSYYYPNFKLESGKCVVTDSRVWIAISGRGLEKAMEKNVKRTNPIETVRKERNN